MRLLEEELRRRGRETWVDWQDIRPAEEFMQAIFPAIEGTDTFVFVLSPDSVTSEICGKELAHAVSHNKRMIPIMARDVEAKAVPIRAKIIDALRVSAEAEAAKTRPPLKEPRR